jgi:hypothetical protein
MDKDTVVQYITIASVASVGIASINGSVYWIILEVRYTNRVNIIFQFFGLIVTCVYQACMVLIIFEYFKDTPMTEVLFYNIPWQIFFNCYFIVFIRQCDTLIPRAMVYGSWAYLAFLNVVAVLDTYAYYLEYCVSDKWTWLGILLDVLSSIFIVILERVLNIRIILNS